MTAAHLDVWVDLFAASVARAGSQASLPVVLTDTLRVLPLLESQGQVAWVHTSPLHYRDHLVVPHGHPVPRARIDAAAEPAEANRLLRRTGLCLVAVPSSKDAAVAMAALSGQVLNNRGAMLLFGAPELSGWPAFEGLIRLGALQPIRAGSARVLASAQLAGALNEAGLQDLPRAMRLAEQLSRSRQADLHAEAVGDSHLRLRLRIDPVRLVAAGASTAAHHIAHEGRALFNSRGLGALLLPWGAPCTARLLLRNVRARIDGSEIALGPHTLSPTAVDYTEHGAFLRLTLPAVLPGRDALLHVSLPREAVPSDGFCDIGAAEFTVETA